MAEGSKEQMMRRAVAEAVASAMAGLTEQFANQTAASDKRLTEQMQRFDAAHSVDNAVLLDPLDKSTGPGGMAISTPAAVVHDALRRRYAPALAASGKTAFAATRAVATAVRAAADIKSAATQYPKDAALQRSLAWYARDALERAEGALFEVEAASRESGGARGAFAAAVDEQTEYIPLLLVSNGRSRTTTSGDV